MTRCYKLFPCLHTVTIKNSISSFCFYSNEIWNSGNHSFTCWRWVLRTRNFRIRRMESYSYSAKNIELQSVRYRDWRPYKSRNAIQRAGNNSYRNKSFAERLSGHIVEFWHCSDATTVGKRKKNKSFLINSNLVVDARDGCSTSAVEKGLDQGRGSVSWKARKRVKLRNIWGMLAPFDRSGWKNLTKESLPNRIRPVCW